MKYLSLFSGIEAASAAWHPLGWECVGEAEIDKFPLAVLAHRYPGIHNFGDITKITEEQIKSIGHIDLIVGGFPCQDLSVAGKRKGLKHEDGTNTRSGLFHVAMQIVRWARTHCGLRWLLVENVPGLFSSSGGNDFACVLGEMVGTRFDPPAGKWKEVGMALGPDGLAEWCVLDAQWFGVAQRRRRVFALCDFSVADIGIESRSGPVLFEPESLRGNPPPSREKGQKPAGTIAARTRGGGGLGTDFDCDGGVISIQEIGKRQSGTPMNGVGHGSTGDPMYTLQSSAVHGVLAPCMKGNAGKNSDAAMEAASLIVHSLRAEGFDASEDGTGRGTPLVPVKWPATIAPTLNASFGDKQGLEDQHALGGGGLFVPAENITLPERGRDGEIGCRNGNADSDAARRFL